MDSSSVALTFSLAETPEQLRLQLSGALTRFTRAELKSAFQTILTAKNSKVVNISTENITQCDSVGLIYLKQQLDQLQKLSIIYTMEAMPALMQSLWSFIFAPAQKEEVLPEKKTYAGLEKIGYNIAQILIAIKQSFHYTGEIVACFGFLLRHPTGLDLKKVATYIEEIGPNSIPLTFLIGLLFGLIMAFQSANMLKSFGAEIYVANLVSVSLVKELGPLLMAIILTGRIASAYAAEISAMQVNQEIDALKVMGLDPIPYLVLPRLVATALIAPFIALFMDFFGLLGCGVMMLTEGFTRQVIITQMFAYLSIGDLVSSLFKSMVFGFLIAGIGCFHGLNSARNAAAVGSSTTQTMVSCIAIVTTTDGLFTTLLFYLGL